MTSKKRCIVSFAKRGRENYPEGLPRLIGSALRNGHASSDFIVLSPDLGLPTVAGVEITRDIPSIPSHAHIPYGFKPWLFKEAFSRGYEQVLWCDSTIIIHKPLDTVWQLAESRGLFVGDNPGCPISFWTADDALDKMGCPRDCMVSEISACALAIDISHPVAKIIFDEWFDLCNDGITFAGRGGSQRPEFRGHRHDQSAMSWLCTKHKVPYEPYGMICYHNDIPKFAQHTLANTGIGQV